MNKNLLWKIVFILATVLFFLYGILGIPKSLSGEGLANALTDHIHLGLDLKGGTHLILQVHVNDAVNVDAQNAIETLKQQLKSRKIDYADISQPDSQNSPDRIVIKGVQAGARSDLLSVVRDRLPEYDITGGAQDTWTMSMKSSNLSDLKNKAVSQAGESLAGIGEHINDTSLMITRAQDKIAGMQAHADAVDSLLDSGVLDQPGLGGSALDAQLQVTAMENDVQAKLAALKAQAKLPAPAAAAAPALGEAGIVIRIHGEGQFRLDASLRDPLDTYDHTLVAAVRAGDDAAYHAALAELFTFVRDKGIRVPADDILSSDIVLPSDDMTLAEVTDLLAREAWLELNSTP